MFWLNSFKCYTISGAPFDHRNFSQINYPAEMNAFPPTRIKNRFPKLNSKLNLQSRIFVSEKERKIYRVRRLRKSYHSSGGKGQLRGDQDHAIERSNKIEVQHWFLMSASERIVKAPPGNTGGCFIARFAARHPSPRCNKTYWDLNRIWNRRYTERPTWPSDPGRALHLALYVDRCILPTGVRRAYSKRITMIYEYCFVWKRISCSKSLISSRSDATV